MADQMKPHIAALRAIAKERKARADRAAQLGWPPYVATDTYYIVLIRLLNNISITENGCWEWCSHKIRKGYGVIFAGKKKMKLVHRISYEMLRGKIPRYLVSDHLCRNTSYCNPWHIELVTPRENVLRGNMVAVTKAYRKTITHCPHGHEYSKKNTILHSKTAGRMCRECIRISTEKYKARKRNA